MASDFDLKAGDLEALDGVAGPTQGKSLMAAKMVEKVEVDAGAASVTVVFEDDIDKKVRWGIEDAIADAVEALEGISDVNVIGMTRSGFEGNAPAIPKPAPAPAGPPPANPGNVPQSRPLEGVGKVIAVASGKGGVGKSTVAVNLALALSKLGHNVGLLDVDIYGPSLPTMLGISGRPAVKDRQIVPLQAEGLKVMSLGFLMDDDTPVIWRGPIVSGIIRQFLQDVDWRGTDYLILDLPPGTGDAQLSLAQSVPLDAAIVVTTPSDLALIDAARGLQMFKTLKVPVMGIVENMSHFHWPGGPAIHAAVDKLKSTGADKAAIAEIEKTLGTYEKMHIFGEGGGKKEARRLGTQFLGEIPLSPEVRAGGDSGKPIVAGDIDSPVSQAFMELARRVAREQPTGSAAEEQPKKRRGLFSFLRG